MTMIKAGERAADLHVAKHLARFEFTLLGDPTLPNQGRQASADHRTFAHLMGLRPLFHFDSFPRRSEPFEGARSHMPRKQLV